MPKSNLSEMAVLIPSCDKYSDVWPYFFKLLFKYWPNINANNRIYLLSNHNIYPDARVKTILVKDEISWSSNMIQALNQIEEPYVLVMLEDFLLMREVDTDQLENLYQIMKQKNAGYLRLMANPPPSKTCEDCKGVGFIEKGSPYRASLQVAIWKKDILLSLLNPYESPWDFEINASIRSNTLPESFLSIESSCAQPIPYFPNTIVRGLWVKEALEFLIQEGFNEEKTRSAESRMQAWFRRNVLRTLVSRFAVQPLKKVIKNFNNECRA